MPGGGIEPPNLSVVDFESTASANSATRARAGRRNVGARRVVSTKNSGADRPFANGHSSKLAVTQAGAEGAAPSKGKCDL